MHSTSSRSGLILKKVRDMTYGSDYSYIPLTSIYSGVGTEVLPDLFCFTTQIVNMVFVGDPDGASDYVIIDAGTPKSADMILSSAIDRFGSQRKPKAIILTHGHFDHVGSIIELIDYWNIPVYAHELELPYLTGKKRYPEFDTTVEGGLVSKLSSILPNEPIDLGNRVHSLPHNGTVPEMPGWRWVHTPGHTPGHISLFRESDRALIAGDAFITVKQEYLYRVFTQKLEISGPPRYITTDWQMAWESVKRLEALRPSAAITGHGLPITGQFLRDNLQRLVSEFDTIAIPDYGKYTH